MYQPIFNNLRTKKPVIRYFKENLTERRSNRPWNTFWHISFNFVRCCKCRAKLEARQLRMFLCGITNTCHVAVDGARINANHEYGTISFIVWPYLCWQLYSECELSWNFETATAKNWWYLLNIVYSKQILSFVDDRWYEENMKNY